MGKKRKAPPKRGAAVTGGRAIERLTPRDQVTVREQVAEFLEYEALR